MFCTQCGTQNPEGTITCTNCGADMGTENQTIPSKKFDPVALFNQLRAHKYFIPGVAGVAGLIVLIVLLSVLLGGAKTKPIDKVMKGIVKADAEIFLKAFPKDYIEYAEDEYDDFEDDLEETLEWVSEILEDDLGDNIKFKYEVIKEKELSKNKLDDLKDELNEDYGLSRRDITEAWEIKIDVTFSGSDDDDDTKFELIVIKYNGKWYISPNSDLF